VTALRVPALLRPAGGILPPEPAAVVARRRRVVAATLVAGVGLLAGTLAVDPDSAAFFVLGFLLAGTWSTGSLLSGPVHLGRSRRPVAGPGGAPTPGRRTVVGPIVLGALAYLAFLAAYLLVRDVPVFEGALAGILDRADAAPLGWVLALALANAVAEEMFFRGALHDAVGGREAPWVATAAYVATTVAGRNVALVVAALVMGTLVTLERLATRGVLAPMLTHATWSTLMLLALPR
jgi:membrane protease YdiL (CAAX protease family)